MTDRELLELAAKAVRCTITWEDWEEGGTGPYLWGFTPGDERGEWNPLTDAGDRYRLAQKLGLSINFVECTVWKVMHDHFQAGVRAGMATVKESLTTGKQRLQVPTGWAAPKDQYAVPVLFNPYTGEPRDVRDVQSDPQGILIVPPGKVHLLAAMQGGQQ